MNILGSTIKIGGPLSGAPIDMPVNPPVVIRGGPVTSGAPGQSSPIGISGPIDGGTSTIPGNTVVISSPHRVLFCTMLLALLLFLL